MSGPKGHDAAGGTAKARTTRLPATGLGGLLAGGLPRAAGHRRRRMTRRAATAGRQLHPDLDGRRADALRDVRSQAGGPGGNPRRVRRHRDAIPGVHFSQHMQRLAAIADSLRSSARSATTRATTVRATTT